METYRVRDYKLGEIRQRVERMNRRAAKLGLAPISIEVLSEDTVPVVYPVEHPLAGLPTGAVKVYSTIAFTGSAPVVSNHTFIARIEHHAEGNLLSKAPGVTEELPQYRSAPPKCEHCDSIRRRNDTFVLKTPEGTLKQVGRNCLADFLRTTDVAAAISLFTLLEDLVRHVRDDDEDSLGSFGRVTGFGVIEILAATASVIRHEGWVSSKAAREQEKCSTASRVEWLLSPTFGHMSDREVEERRTLTPTEGDYEEAKAVVAWAKGLTVRSDYDNNLKVACSLFHIEFRTVPLVASAVTSYRRTVERELAAKAVAKPVAGHFGELGKRYDLELTVKFVREWESDYGVTTLIAFEDTEGHLFKWKASGAHDVKPGERYRVKGTVKIHGDYKGVSETGLSRCVLTPVPADSTPNT